MGAHICVIKITANGLDRYLVKYIAKEEPTFGLYVVSQNEVQKYLETRVIGSPEASAIQMSHPIVKCNLGVVYIDTNSPENRVRILKPQKEITEENDDSEEIYEKAGREHYMSRPKTNEFENVTFPKYMSEYNHTAHKNLPKYAVLSQQETLDNLVVYKRAKPLIPHTHFLTVLDGEAFYYQHLLWCIPFRDDKF